jgi:uncharacterized protein (DUF885 family)
MKWQMRRWVAAWVLGLASAACASTGGVRSTTGTDPGKSFDDLLARYWDFRMSESPEDATRFGDDRFNDKLSDPSLAHVPERRKALEGFLASFQAVPAQGLADQQRVTRELVIRRLQDDLSEIDLKLYEMPLNQLFGTHLAMALLPTFVPVDTPQHVAQYVTRLHAIPHVFDSVIEVARQGQKDGLIPPKFLLLKVAKQCTSIADLAGEKSPFGIPATKLNALDEKDRKLLHDAIVAAVDLEIRPAYAKLAAFVTSEYAPAGRTDPGFWSLPNGDAIYRFRVRQMTTTDLEPQAIHELGLSEVARIETEMTAIARQLGYADLPAFREALKKDPRQYLGSREEILDHYRTLIAGMKPQLPQLFGRLPKADVEVQPVEEFREKEAPPAQYNVGTPDGKRLGRVMINTSDPTKRPVFMMDAIAYHEGIPGHHMQLSIAQEMPGLPPFRQHGQYVAYSEGWGLYAELVGKDAGMYRDPYSDYGRLSSELFRAVRLVVDTGVHYKHWDRDQMVAYFHQHSDLDETSVQAETDRYIVAAGQALTYKIGQLKFIELRDRAKAKLGTKFDIRAFHDQMLANGALPLDVLDRLTDEWIVNQAR